MRQRLVFALLVAFALWPLVHRGLVHRYGLDPWKFGGWAMYTVARKDPQVVVQVDDDSGLRPVLVKSASLRAEMARYPWTRRMLGPGHEPARLGRLGLRQEAKARAIVVDVSDFSLDAEGRVHFDEHRYRYEREPAKAAP